MTVWVHPNGLHSLSQWIHRLMLQWPPQLQEATKADVHRITLG